MRAFHIINGPEGTRLEPRDIATPEPGANQLLVRVRATSLNRGELIPSWGAAPPSQPATRPGGQEAAGEVVATGAGVAGIAIGTRVMGRCKGGFAEYAVLDAGEAMPVPEQMSWEEAAAVPIVFLVSYDMLVPYGRLVRGEWVLITAASSGVGVASLQLAKALGANVIGTSGSRAKLDRLAALGLDAGIETVKGDFVDEAMRLTGGHGADLAVNNVGASVFPALVQAAAYRGRLTTVGYMDGRTTAEIDLGAVHAKRLEIFGVSNKNRTTAERALTVAGFSRDCLGWLADGAVRPLIDRVFAFGELPAAKAYVDSNAQVGKVVVRL